MVGIEGRTYVRGINDYNLALDILAEHLQQFPLTESSRPRSKTWCNRVRTNLLGILYLTNRAALNLGVNLEGEMNPATLPFINTVQNLFPFSPSCDKQIYVSGMSPSLRDRTIKSGVFQPCPVFRNDEAVYSITNSLTGRSRISNPFLAQAACLSAFSSPALSVDWAAPGIDDRCRGAQFIFLKNPSLGPNETYQRTLYAQFLRLVCELKNQNCPNLVVIDTSGGVKIWRATFKKLAGQILS